MNDDWRPSDDLDAEIFAHQPTSRLTLSEYGHLASEINDDSHFESTNPFLSSGQQFISNIDLSVQLRNTASIEIEMGKLLTSDKILQTNDDDDDGNEGRKVAAEIRAMITNAGLNNYDDGTAFRNSTARTILADSAPKIIHEKKYPILMDKRYFQFRKKMSKQEDSILEQSESSSSQYDDVTTSTESGQSSFASTSTSSTSASTSYSPASETSSVIGFYNHMKHGDVARHQLSIKETLLKPKEIYFIKKVKQSEVKKAIRVENNAKITK